MSDYQLMWLFHGRSPAYELFLGIVEILCVGLVLFRLTRPIGALATLAVLSNIIVMDLAFGIGTESANGMGALVIAVVLGVLAGILVILQRDTYRAWYAACLARLRTEPPFSSRVRLLGGVGKLAALACAIALYAMGAFWILGVFDQHDLSGTWLVKSMDDTPLSALGGPRLAPQSRISFDSWGLVAVRNCDLVNYGTYEMDPATGHVRVSIFDVTFADYRSIWDRPQAGHERLFQPDRSLFEFGGRYFRTDNGHLELRLDSGERVELELIRSASAGN